MTAAFPTVEQNPWLACSIALTLLVLAPGLAWNGLLPPPSDDAPWRRRLHTLALTLLIGLCVAVLAALALAEAGCLDYRNLAIAVAAISISGLFVRRFIRPPDDDRNSGALVVPAIAAIILFVGSAAIMKLPHRSEWILGGWDPGVYQNQGIHTAHSGTFHDPPIALFKNLTPAELDLFTRGENGYVEIDPGIPIDPATAKILNYFFRLTPSLIATLDLAGGIRAATRVNDFAALIGLVLFAAMLSAWRRPALEIVLALALLILQPLWLYNTHVPTSEMFHLLFICAAGFLLPHLRRHRAAPALFGLILFISILNRFDSIVFSALLIAAVAVIDFTRDDRAAVLRERSYLIAGLIAGALTDAALCAVTLLRLQRVMPMLFAVTAALLAAALLVDFIASRKNLRDRLAFPARHWNIAIAAAATLGVLFIVLIRHTAIGARIIATATNNAPYLGVFALIAALGGLIRLLASATASREQKLFVLFLLAATASMLIEGHIVPTYPWSTRRFLPYLVPAVALLAAQLIATAASARGNPGGRIAAIGLLLAIPLAARQHVLIRQAWTSTEFSGTSRALAEVAAHLAPGDIVIADHHWWATPLTFIYDRPVLNGGFLLKKGPDALARAAAAASRWQREGRNVLWLTSTKSGLRIYERPVTNDTVLWTSAPLTIDEVKHTKTPNGFATAPRVFVFQLHRWQPE